ncbi:hypothetical protein SAMN05421749_10427 [Acinetobacter marinus]|uniref:Uncharacterized protein n=1 Tax=Acinetobacter marinus TaxID=281375 RepID=A0A1G6KF83_9GAMM|nr:hypothetical protein [Acinetobacter marinus]SDC29235.1 hypothetical protein SAMN05421749_10427 [Acinetobacter marinus]
MPYLFVFLVMLNALFLGAQVYQKSTEKSAAQVHAQHIEQNRSSEKKQDF